MIAATDGKELYPLRGVISTPARVKLSPIKTLLARTFDLAHDRQIRQLWIMPGSPLHARLKKVRKIPTKEASGWSMAPRELRNLMSAWAKERQRVQVIAPGLVASQWALDDVKDVALWREIVASMIEYAGVSPSIPIRTAKLIAERCVRLDWLNDRAADLSAFVDNIETDLSYKAPRVPPGIEGGDWFLHCYDKRNMYLSACAMALGVGELIDWKPSRQNSADFAKNEKYPALYQCEIYRANPYAAAYFFGDEKQRTVKRWLYSPVVNFFRAQGFGVRIINAIGYKDRHRVLETFYERISHALREIPKDGKLSPEAKRITAKCFKACYTQFIGWMGHDPGDRPERFYRPDWRHFIIAESKARMGHNIEKALALDPRALLAGVRVDSVMWWSKNPDPAVAMPAPFCGDGAAYRVKYSVPARIAIPILGDAGVSIQQADDLMFAEAKKLES